MESTIVPINEEFPELANPSEDILALPTRSALGPYGLGAIAAYDPGEEAEEK